MPRGRKRPRRAAGDEDEGEEEEAAAAAAKPPSAKGRRGAAVVPTAASQIGKYVHYRGASLGVALTATLEAMVSEGKMGPDAAEALMRQYDRSIADALAARSARDGGRALALTGDLRMYRQCDGVWTWVVSGARVKGSDVPFSLKIVACDGRIEETEPTSSTTTKKK